MLLCWLIHLSFSNYLFVYSFYFFFSLKNIWGVFHQNPWEDFSFFGLFLQKLLPTSSSGSISQGLRIRSVWEFSYRQSLSWTPMPPCKPPSRIVQSLCDDYHTSWRTEKRSIIALEPNEGKGPFLILHKGVSFVLQRKGVEYFSLILSIDSRLHRGLLKPSVPSFQWWVARLCYETKYSIVVRTWVA